MKTKETWFIRKSYYMTYDEMKILGDKDPETVATHLSFEEAQKYIEILGFGHNIHPEFQL